MKYVQIQGVSADLYSNIDIPLYSPFNSVREVEDDAYNVLTNPPQSAVIPTNPTPFNLPAGNVAYVRTLGSNKNITITGTWANRLTGAYGRMENTNIMVAYDKDLPTDVTTYPLSGSVYPTFGKSGATNVTGQSHTASTTVDGSITISKYTVILNPYGYNLSNETGVPTDLNPTLQITGYFSEVKIYPLDSTYNLVNGDSFTADPDDALTSDNITTDGGDVTFQNNDGQTVTPNQGGNNTISENETYVSVIAQIKNLISRLVERIEGTFDVGHSAIGTLVNAMHNFVGIFGQLYSWMPTEVYNVVISAIMIAVVIGVFKVFL